MSTEITPAFGASSAVPSAKRRRREWLLLAAVLVVALVYFLSPYVSFWCFTRAIQAQDRTALEDYVDFPSVRQSLKDELRGKLPAAQRSHSGKKEDAFSGLISRLAPSLIDQLVDAFVTPDGLAALITDPTVASEAKAKDPDALMRIHTAPRHLDWKQVKHGYFTGVRAFEVDLDGTRLRFRFAALRWRLKTVQLRALT